jgi:dihydrofolate reductase
MKLSLIVAVAENGVIGARNGLPWRIPADLKRFKLLTRGHPVIMGRKTYDSIGKPLPERRNIVITRQDGWTAAGVESVATLEAAIKLCEREPEIFVIGGAQIYALALPHADRLYLTRVHRIVDGDAYFPRWEDQEFRLIQREEHPETADNPLPFSYLDYERVTERSGIKA